MILLEEALAIINSHATTFGEELVPLEEADGRILGENIIADRNYPPFNRAAMDGFAIRLDDWNKGLRIYQIQEVIFTGQASEKPLEEGQCYKIMTGAATPESATAIVRKEDAIECGNGVQLIPDSVKLYQNIAMEGEDARKGQTLLCAPVNCTPQVMSLLASVGKHQVLVRKMPRVAVLTSGNEVISPGQQVSEFQIRNSNKYLLTSLLKKWGIKPTFTFHLPDDRQTISSTLSPLLDHDIIILNGGVSAGDADFIPEVLCSLGVNRLFHKVAIRPGKPLWCGKSKGGIVFALPGNPLSCLTTFTVFIESYLYKCFGFPERPIFKLPVTNERIKKSNLTEFFPVKYDVEGAQLSTLAFNGSGDITAGLLADGLGIQPLEKASIQAGEHINFLPF